MEISNAARSIARMTNAATRDRGLDSGFLVFGFDGTGGAYYTDNARPNMAGCVRVSLTGRHLTAIRAQEILDSARVASGRLTVEEARYAQESRENEAANRKRWADAE